MDHDSLLDTLNKVRSGALTPRAAMETLRHLPAESLGFATIDHHRRLRQGFPEVIYCEGKNDADVIAIARQMLARAPKGPLLATRASETVYKRIRRFAKGAVWHPRSRAIVVEPEHAKKSGGVLVISAGTSDIPVAEEAALTASVMGAKVETLYDVGVAGIHRLLGHARRLTTARVIVVVAGMDGALASVVGGLTGRPVVAVPTSVGYGAAFGGVAALLAMLNSCAGGVAVMNIDNGFGAGVLASRINSLPESVER